MVLNHNLLNINICVSEKNNQPMIELRRIITDPDIVKAILTCTFYQSPITLLPTFTNQIKSISSLIEKGILKKTVNQDGSIDYDFLI